MLKTEEWPKITLQDSFSEFVNQERSADRSYPLLILKYSKARTAVVHCVQRIIRILNFIRHIICSGRSGTVTLSD